MKILVNGAFSTGKTAFANSVCTFLLARGVSYCSLDETARHCPFPLNKEQSFSGTQWLLHEQISREIAAQLRSHVVVIDRGVPDVLAHYLETCERLGATSPSIEALLPYLTMWCRTYDIVFTTCVEESIDIPADGVRVVDKAFRQLMEQYNQEAIRSMGMSLCYLPYQVQSNEAELKTFLEKHIRL